jgi:hypothetical protein
MYTGEARRHKTKGGNQQVQKKFAESYNTIPSVEKILQLTILSQTNKKE